MADYDRDYDMTMDNEAYTPDALGEVSEILERLEQTVLSAKAVPFSANCMLDREDLLVTIGLMRDALPVELKQARWLLDQSRELLETARQEASSIVDDAEHEVASMIDEHEITQQARTYAQELVAQAQEDAAEIEAAAYSYTEQRLVDLEDQVATILMTIRKHKQELQDR